MKEGGEEGGKERKRQRWRTMKINQRFFFFNVKWKMFKEESKICKVTNWRKRFKIIRR